MMADYDNTDRGVLFKNDKEGNDSRPDYKGNINVDGTEYFLSAWIKTSKGGDKFMSLSVQPKEVLGKMKTKPKAPVGEDGDIPF
jgi:uncharacterized protein (DUF736 family)